MYMFYVVYLVRNDRSESSIDVILSDAKSIIPGTVTGKLVWGKCVRRTENFSRRTNFFSGKMVL